MSVRQSVSTWEVCFKGLTAHLVFIMTIVCLSYEIARALLYYVHVRRTGAAERFATLHNPMQPTAETIVNDR